MIDLTSQQAELQKRAHQLSREIVANNAKNVDETEQYPWDNVKALTEAGFMGMTIPVKHGGLGLSCFDAALVVEQMAQRCAATGRIVVEANLGAVGAVMTYGTAKQAHAVAEHVLQGDKPAISITEPAAGSAATEMTTWAEQRGDEFVINGKKHWITGGGVSQVYLVFAKVIEGGKSQGIGAFIAFAGQDGLKIGSREPAMGVRGCPETEVILEDLVVPQGMALFSGRGAFGSLMQAYNGQRVGAATVALGIGEGAFELARGRVTEREQFGRPIYEFQGVQWMLADMDLRLQSARELVFTAARNAGSGFPDAADAARAKIAAGEAAQFATYQSLQLFGAEGYSRRQQPLERMERDARMFTIAGGTSQILRTVLAENILERKLPQRRGAYQAA